MGPRDHDLCDTNLTDATQEIVYLVGHSRGGTTWMGELLAMHPDVEYVFEPFASQAHRFTGIDTQTLVNGGRWIRRNKRGQRELDIPFSKFFNLDAEEEDLALYRGLLRLHLSRLTEDRDSRKPILLLKQPRLENVGFVAGAIGAEHVFFLDRHPFAIVNSYRRGGFRPWLEREWPLAKATVPSRYPEYGRLFADATDWQERLLALSYVRSQVVGAWVRQRPDLAIRVEYESLCDDPRRELSRLCRAVRLPITPELERKWADSAKPTNPDSGHPLDTNKVPRRRADGWRRELPPWVLRRLTKFSEIHGLEIDLPGRELERLRLGERFGGTTRWVFASADRGVRVLFPYLLKRGAG